MNNYKEENADIDKLVAQIKESSHCVAFTGAGISTLSGIPDFRSDKGIYNTGGSQEMFDLDVFLQDPSVYYDASRSLLYNLDAKKPSIVHTTLAKMEKQGYLQGVITQNVDLLHTRAGSQKVYEVHGSPSIHRCLRCGAQKSFDEIAPVVAQGEIPQCSKCRQAYKPEITFFGEALPQHTLNAAQQTARSADLMLVLGSSLTVYPAAGLPEVAVRHGAKLAIINQQNTYMDPLAQFRFQDLQQVFERINDKLFED
ncbi:MAG: NAD-dependent deacetylase [Fibrobacter sp.]|nr:NAD-dependent deacetylase [Fibrobacter sp.]